jgi:hypothetical protein
LGALKSAVTVREGGGADDAKSMIIVGMTGWLGWREATIVAVADGRWFMDLVGVSPTVTDGKHWLIFEICSSDISIVMMGVRLQKLELMLEVNSVDDVGGSLGFDIARQVEFMCSG